MTAAVTALAQLGLNPKITRIYSGAQPDTVTAQQPARRRPRDQGHDRAHQRLARREAGPRAGRDRPAVREREVGARGPGLHRQPHRRPVRPGRGRRRRRLQTRRPARASRRARTITLSVSKGPATTQVPDVTNHNQADATTILQQAGLTVAVITDPVTDPSQDGIVISQDPAPGADAKAGEVVIDPRRPADRVARRRRHHDADHHHDAAPVTRRIAVILGGRSSENAISLASAASVIDALSRERQRGRARADRPVGGAGSSARRANLANLVRRANRVQGSRSACRRARSRRPSRTSTSSSRCCTGRSARTGRCRDCSSSPVFPTSAPACSPRRSAWTRTSSSRCCATTTSR